MRGKATARECQAERYLLQILALKIFQKNGHILDTKKRRGAAAGYRFKLDITKVFSTRCFGHLPLSSIWA